MSPLHTRVSVDLIMSASANSINCWSATCSHIDTEKSDYKLLEEIRPIKAKRAALTNSNTKQSSPKDISHGPTKLADLRPSNNSFRSRRSSSAIND